VRNPHIVDRPLTDQDLFFGRDKELVQLGRLLLDGERLVLVFGQPRIGKTSFANQLPSRLGERYHVQRVDLSVPDPQTGEVLNWTLPASMGELLWQIAAALARAVDQPVLRRVDFLRHPEAAMTEVLRAFPADPEGRVRVVCIDALPAANLLSQPPARAGIELLQRLLVDDGRLAIILMVNGNPLPPEGGELAPIRDNEIVLGPLHDEEAEDLLMVPVRGTIAYSYEAVYHIQRLSGGHPYFLQLFGYVLFEERVTYGWVGRPEVDQVLDRVQAARAPYFQLLWERSSPAAKLTLCAIAELRGTHGVPSARDVVTFFRQTRVLIPPEHVQEALRELIGYVPQKAVLFAGTITDNVGYGNPGASRTDLERAVAIAQARDLVDRADIGYDGEVAQGGSTFSGGQRQRLSIARAVASDPRIYLFDDSFSALDFRTERALRTALERETGDVTTVVVAQRIGTIRHADRIVVLDFGRTVGVGTHDELMDTCAVYREIAESQLSAEELDR